MESERFEITASDGYVLKGERFASPGASEAVIVLHGIQSHSGWYGQSCAFLAEKGFSVFAIDRRGSGRNEAERGHANDFHQWLDDVDRIRERASGEVGCERVHLEGISWGGNLALAYAAWKPERTASLALVAPGLEPRIDLTAAQKALVGISIAVHPHKKIPIPITDGAMFTANPERIAYIDGDPLSLREATARFYMQSARLSRWWRRHVAQIVAPTLLMLAGTDRIIDNERTRKTFSTLGGDNNSCVVYEESGHTLEFDENPGAFFRDLAGWFDKWNERPGD